MKSAILATALTVALTMSTAHAQQKVQMSSSYPSSLPILGTAPMGFVERINLISDKVVFEHHEPNKLIPTLEASGRRFQRIGRFRLHDSPAGGRARLRRHRCSPRCLSGRNLAKCWPGSSMMTA